MADCVGAVLGEVVENLVLWVDIKICLNILKKWNEEAQTPEHVDKEVGWSRFDRDALADCVGAVLGEVVENLVLVTSNKENINTVLYCVLIESYLGLG